MMVGAFLLLGAIGAFAVLAATLDRTVYTTETLVVIPSAVEAPLWNNANEVLVQDLDEEALYQDFSSANSAYIDKTEANNSEDDSEPDPLPESDPVGETPSEDQPDPNALSDGEEEETPGIEEPATDETAPTDTESGEETTDEPAVEDEEAEETTEEDAAEASESATPEPEPPPVEEEPAPASEPESSAADQTDPDPVSWKGFEVSSTAFPLVQFSNVTSTPAIDPPIADADLEPEPDSLPESDPVGETPSEDQPDPNALSDGEEEETPGIEEAESNVTGEEPATDETALTDTESGEETTDEPAVEDEEAESEEMTEEDETETGSEEDTEEALSDEDELLSEEDPVEPAFVLDPCLPEAGCVSKPMTFTGFQLPEFERGTRLDSAQIRLSLAAQATAKAGEIQRFVVEYSYDTGESWTIASVIDIEDEVSNSINGGYYLVTLPIPKQVKDFSRLALRVSYEGVESALEKAYVESVWLEVKSGTFYEADEYMDPADVLDYERDLLLPKYLNLTGSDTDVALNHLPSFSVEYDPQQNFLRRVFNSVFSENNYAVNRVTLTDGNGNAIDVPFSVVYHDDTTWTIKIDRQPQKLRSGKYTLTAEIEENGEIYTDNFEFYWGVLAVNTTKSMYFPGEAVELNLAALTDSGDTICNAILDLKIISPDNTINEVPVTESGSCGKNNITDIPDYLAHYSDTHETGVYTLQLQHLNQAGEVVHKINDSFEVRDYIPYDIKRTAPTRIYPPSPYTVTLDIKAYRDFEGDITERVPRGFVISKNDEVLQRTLPEYTELVWENVTMKEGETLTLSYEFDAPDISPYMYLLGPLDMDGFRELRHWQIASDALSAVAWLEATQSVAAVNLNQVSASPLVWSDSSFDSVYFDHSTSTNPQQLVVKQAGDYVLNLNLPVIRTGGSNARGTRIGAEVRVNGTLVPHAVGRSSYISYASDHEESSSHINVILDDLNIDDYIEVYVEGLTLVNAADTVMIDGVAGLYVEYVPPLTGVFSATAVETTNSTELNQTTARELEWTETRQDTGFVHSDSVTPEDIIISDPGLYAVNINLPITGNASNQNLLGSIMLDGSQVPGGIMSQGYIYGNTNSNDDYESSLHWSGVVETTATDQVLSISIVREAAAGSMIVTSGLTGSILIQELPASDIIALRGQRLVSGTDWDNGTKSPIQWNNQIEIDSGVFTHSTFSNSDEITINENGDYYLSFNGAFTSATARANNSITVEVNGSVVSGAEANSNFIRNQGNHNNSSSNMTFLLTGLTAGDVVTVSSQREAANATTNDAEDALLLMWKKLEKNFEPDSPSTYNDPFDNIRTASTTPYFEFSAADPDGSSGIVYEFSISTTSDFSASSTYNSSSDSGFHNVDTPLDTSPFNESDRIRYQIQPGDELEDLVTYYWKTRATDVAGSGQWSDWSTTHSFSVNLNAEVPNWYQTYGPQFENNSFVGAGLSGANSVQVDASINSEILIAYGEGTDDEPRYRLWNGTAWGIEQTAEAVNGTINWLRTAAGTARDEYAMITIDSANDVHAQIYSASTSDWGNLTQLTNNINTPSRRGIDVAFESQSGDAIAVACDNDSNPTYQVWDGSSWSGSGTIVLSSFNDCNFITLASDPTSDEIILVSRDTGSQYEAQVWDGDSWGNSITLGSAALASLEGIAVSYENSGDQAIVAVSNGSNNNVIYTTWNGSEWSSTALQTIQDDFQFGAFAVDSNSDQMALCYIDTDNDLGVLLWNGGIFDTYTERETSGNSDLGLPVGCEFETVPGRSGNLLFTYSDTVNLRYQEYTGSWGSEQTISDIQDSFWVRTERAEDGTIVAVAHDDAVSGDALQSTYWNGTSWSAKEIIETTPSSVLAAPYEIYDLSAKRFQFNEGVVTTKPIEFGFVPGQPTWGDLTFSSTEPFGADVKVRLRYSAVTACDTYVSNTDLPGNSDGFDVLDLPIDLTGLSTSTYDALCLEATITTTGAASATLNDWSLSWVREPKLSQSAYRWYANGSFLTPTDPWPLGISDVAENTSLTSTEAVNINEIIRLRLALKGVNVPLPIDTEIFKLQYAAGFTCSPALAWSDVGEVGSSTAAWRGYENAIVGDDWYDESWGRRVSVTVDAGLVDDDVTDFPVYLNLDDLPSAFFTKVKSDGGDIRITRSDGVTEVPYDLVSIDTGTGSGELHFLADLSSSTDSVFYIYYDNSGASAYSASDTYGSENVWANDYDLRYALDDSPVSASPQFRDSTDHGNHAVAYSGMTSGDVVSGQIGQAIDLDGNDGGTFQSALAYPGPFTISMWWNTNGDGFVIAGPGGTNEKFGAWNTPANHLFARVLTSSDTSVVNPADGTWGHIVLTRDNSNKVDVFVNGTRTRLYGDIAQSGISDWNNFGGETSQGFHGLLDELRFAGVRRSNGWITTEYNNQSNPTGFYDVSAEELISDGRNLPSTVLTNSDHPETYEEVNPTRSNQNILGVDEEAEWDFVLQNHAGEANTYYCFRLVYEDGSIFNSYPVYPRLITNAPPVAPILSAPFDNERLASTTPWFEFSADDEFGDNVSYEIEIDNDPDFGSPLITRESNANFTQFNNITAPAERGIYTTGQTVRFIPNVSLSNGTTYWWRVRARDDNGSGTYGAWSDPSSVTINTSTSITTWFQTTQAQFDTDNLADVRTNASNDIGLDTGFSVGTTTSTVIDYDDRDTGNAWGTVSFNHNISSGSIRYYVEYRVSDTDFALIPDSDLSGNSSGFTSSVSLVNLNTTIYNEIRLVAVLTGNTSAPRLQDWTVTWSERIEIPTIEQPFDNAKVDSTTPTFDFFTTDPENDTLQYELEISASSDFASADTFQSGADAGFANQDTPADTSPFDSGASIRYTAQSALSNGNTYWWRVRARDPLGGNSWSDFTTPHSFTVDTSITTSVWHQTTGDQFLTNELFDIETDSDSARITSTIREVMAVYGEGTGQAPQYRSWNGSSWSEAASADNVEAQISKFELKASPARPEYVLGTLGTDLDVNFQIYNADIDAWGDKLEVVTNAGDVNKKSFSVAYETNSGDAIAVSCDNEDAVYAVWNGTSWSSINNLVLSNSNDCEFIEMASDPVSDEIIAVFRHTNSSSPDYQVLVWNGSSWGDSVTFGDMTENGSRGIAVNYEESGNQAIVVASNGNSANFIYNVWNGSSWSGTATQSLGSDFEFGILKADQGSDAMALCYIDGTSDVGVVLWSGSAWGTFTELDTNGNNKAGKPIDCEFETVGANDGDLLVAYSDTTATRYRTYDGSFSGENSLDSITDAWEVNLTRAADGVILVSAYDDARSPDRIDLSSWDGDAWSSLERLTDNSSLNGAGTYNDGVSMAAQIYPNFTNGSMLSTAIVFADGTGPRWEEANWTDSTPGASVIEYRVYYESAPDVFTLIPDSDLPGNSTGFTASPIDLSDIDRSVYTVLKLGADFICDSGDCPTLNDWSVEWSEGINVSGMAYEYDETTPVGSGTVAIAVNGVLQTGKTAAIAGDGSWSVANVTAFPGDSVTAFIDGASDADEAVAVSVYDGLGDVTGLELSKRHLTIGSLDVSTTTNAVFAGYDHNDDEDIFFTINGSNVLAACVEAACSDVVLKIKDNSVYEPGAAIATHDLKNYGTFLPGINTVRVSGSWNDQGVYVPSTGTVIFTAGSGAETLTATTSSHSFYNVTFGESSGTASWTIDKPLDVNGSLVVNYGTLDRGSQSINTARNLQLGAGGAMTGLGTTTFDGAGSYTWSDAATSKSNIGHVIIDGTTKTITLGSSVAAQSIYIGSDDTFNSSGSSFTTFVYGGWVNNNSFIPQNGTVTFAGTSTYAINRGNSAFNNLTFTGTGGNWSFTTPTLALNGTMTIATGTVTLPSGTTTVAGSFLNSGGTFVHNNGEVRMTSSASGRQIQQNGTAFLNAFYDLSFTGSGAWSFIDTAATTTNDLKITNGTVTLPTGQLVVGADFLTSGSGAFAHNNGEVVLLVQDADPVTTNNSVFNDLRIRGGVSTSWLNEDWNYRQPLSILAAQVDDALTDFPVYVDLSDLPAQFFTKAKNDGSDIRVTTSDGVTEVPIELVSYDASGHGELYFKAPAVSDSTNTTFYIYYGNNSASAYAEGDTYGKHNVWSNGYVLVEHMGDLTTNSIENSEGSPDGSKTSANNPLEASTGKIYETQDFSGDSIEHDDVLTDETNFSFSAWINADNLNGSGDTSVYGYSIFGISPSSAPYTWLTAGGSSYVSEFRLCAWENTATNCTGTSGAGLTTGSWNHVSVSATKSGATTIRVNGTERLSYTNDGTGDIDDNLTLGDLRPGRNINFDGRIDEVRVSNVVRSDAWRDAEYRNTGDTSTFYSVSDFESSQARIFADTNMTIAGDYVAEEGGDVLFPTGTLAIGGSFDNNGEFDAHGGTVLFNSTAGSETIAPGISAFATLAFDSATGDFTISEHATATTAVVLTDAAAFTLANGQSLTALGTFSNDMDGDNTTWTGSSLILGSGTDYAINNKASGGDDYGTIITSGDTDVSLWNSSAALVVTSGLSSIYSQDHDAVDGDLYIYGDYARTTGTEYWSYDTDFDGTSLGGGARGVTVRAAADSALSFTGATLQVVGDPAATTTVTDQGAGSFSLLLDGSTLKASYYSFSGLDARGLDLQNGTLIDSLDNGQFTLSVAALGGTSLTVSTTTIDANPGLQIQNVQFDTDLDTGGEAVFLFFDDFNDDSINAAKWTKDVELGSITETSGYLRAGGGITSGNYGHVSLGSAAGYAAFADNAVMFRARNATQGIGEVVIRGDVGGNTGYKARFDQRSGEGHSFLETPYNGWVFSDGTGTCDADTDAPTADQWYSYQITAEGSSLKFYRDGTLKRDCIDSTTAGPGEIALQNHYGDHTDFDWIAVRPFVDPEPAQGAWGSEEEVSTGLYRRSHTINGSTAGAQTDYVLPITVEFGNGSDSGQTVYCDLRCEGDFSDVRFTTADGDPISAWREESYTASSSATFWVKVPSIPASPASASLYIYYGETAGYNVTVPGPTEANSFWWFRNHSGNNDGEDHDSDPGAGSGDVRWDDSASSITVSGIVYSDDGSTPLTGGVCDGSTENLRLIVNGGTYTDDTSCSAVDGSYSFANVSYIGDPKLIVYLNTDGGTRGSVVTKTPTADITDLDLYADRVIVRHEDLLPLTIADMSIYDKADDSDIAFTATVGATSTLVTDANTELYVFASSTFAPGGNITLSGDANANGYEGTLSLGPNAVFEASGTETHTLAGRLVAATSSSITAASSTFVFNASTTGKSLTAVDELELHNVTFADAAGGWNITADLTLSGDMTIESGTVSGTGDIVISHGSVAGDGVLSLGGGTLTINESNIFGGNAPWTVNNIMFGDGLSIGTTTIASAATTTVLGTMTIANAHFLDAGSGRFDLSGTGQVLVKDGTILIGTSTFRYSGPGSDVAGITYYDLILDSGFGSATYTAIGSGLTVSHDLLVGQSNDSIANFTANDPVLIVNGDVLVSSSGTLSLSNSATTTFLGDLDNNGTLTANDGLVLFTGSGSHAIAAGSSSFGSVAIDGSGTFNFVENATISADLSLISHDHFTVDNGVTLDVGGRFFNTLGGAATTWTGSTLSLYGTEPQVINSKTTNDDYETLRVGAGAMVRMWNSSAANYDATGGLYSQDHAGVDGSLYIFGAFTSSGYEDHWSYGTDFDGEDLTGSERAVSVRLASGTEADWNGDALFVIGTSSASTTIDNQGSGTYSLSIGGTTETEWQNVVIRNTDASGLQFADAPIVNDLSFTDHEIAVNGGTAITVAGSVINANEAKNFTNNTFSQGGASGASNVTANGSSVSSWRFTNHAGDLDGEGHDVDPAGDPGYLVWDDSAALITVSGNVYSDEGSTVSSVCDGSTDNVTLVVAGLTAYSTSCNGTTGAYSISNVAFGPTDTLTLYLDGETAKAANVTVAPISSISNMHLYEGRVIVRHENTDPITIADMAEWDSSDDSDVPFTAVDAGTDTLTLASDLKLIIWTGKTFAPNGNVTLAGGGGGSAYDGTLEALANAKFIAAGTENHSIGGSFIFGLGAAFTPANSTVTFTTTGSNRTIDTNNGAFSSVVFDGDGSWTIADDNFTTLAALSQSDGSVTYGSGTTTIGTSMNVSNGSFVMNNGPLVFTATGPANTVRFNGSAVPTVIFDGTGSWNMTDTDAESDGSVIVRGGTVSLPSGTLSIADSFRKSGGTVIHNTSELIFTTNASSTLYANGSDLSAVTMSGSGTLTMEDINVTLRDSLTINAGTINAATGTLTIGGSLDVAAGTFNTASNTILFNASNVGKTINLGGNTLYNATFGSGSGGWTWQGNATTTNNLTLASAAGFVKESGTSLYVGGVFSNLVGGSATTWTGSDLVLGGSLNYSVNNKNVAGDNYDTMTVISDTDVRIWNSNAASLNISSDSSMYSQDHNATNGLLHIYGDFHIATTSEYWSYATDFDGTTLSGGARRAVIVEHATFATTTLHSGSLAIVGAPGASTTIQSSSGTYHLEVAGGTFNASYYEFHDLDINGLTLTGTPAVTDLSNGYFDIAVNTGSLITLASSSLNANASKIFTNVGFNATDPLTGYNVNLVGETANAWRFADSYGSIGNEGFDIDGLDACGSIRFDDSACLLTEQTHFRWRNDDGGAGVPDAEWFDLDWDYRQRIRVVNEDSEAYASTAIKVAVDYDSGMKADFSDLRFTADDGLTPIPFWLEKYTASTEAVVWVRIPSLPAEETATAFMYYGNGSADSASSGTSTFDAFDDYEDDDLDEYSGNTALFTTDTAPVYGGTYSLEASNKSGRTTGGLYRTDLTTAEGQIIRYMQYIDIGSGAVPGDEACTLFGVQGSGANYGLCLEQFGTDRMVLSRDIDDNDISGSVLSSTNVTYTTGWYEVEIIWQTDDSISAYLYDPSGTLAASTTASDSTYASGGIGYTFWYQNGAWDSYTARALGPVKPTVYLGARTTHGGATWLSAADSAGSAAPGDVRRLRMAVENSGLDITDQEFKLEFAAMGAAPSCEAVANANYAPVPNQTACGSSPVCMQASDHVSDNDPTADLLFDTSGSFTAGRVVESPSAATEALDIDQRYYTELEYVITPTINAVDAYCFRVTDNGDPLDYYATIAELSLEFDPVFGPITLNGGGDIALAPGATTTIYAAGTVTDFNGYADIVAGSSTIYRSGAGASCTPNNNDCYVASTDSTCSFINCSGNTCELSCAADIYFHADPTDIGTYEGEEWLAYMEVSDQSGGYDFASASGVELLTLRALAVDSAINYGSLAVGADTGSTNASTTIENLGNTVFDLEIEGTDLVDGNASMIPAEQQKFATTTFNYAACISCSSLSSDEPVAIDLGLSKPTAPAPPVAAPIYWGISVPLGVNSAPHQGINLFTPISAD